jgi:DNA polymerase
MSGFEYINHFNINEKNSYEKPKDIDELSKSISSCHLCDLSKSRQQSMSGFGKVDADLMIIDFCVSMSDDMNNSYYNGRSGESLVNMIEKVIGVKKEDAYYTHAIKCKPLNSNMPSESEWNSCKSYLFSQIDFVKPKVIIALGEDTYSKLTDEKTSFQNVRGHVIEFKNSKLIPIYHPQFLLRNPELKKVTLNDLKIIKSFL